MGTQVIRVQHRMEASTGGPKLCRGVLSRNPVGKMDGSQISCAALPALDLNSREQLIREQREDPELEHIYRYLENPDDGSVNATVCEDLLGPYPASRPERYRYLLVITDHFTKWSELIPLRKASAQAIAYALFENYILRYGAPISLISDKGPQFISEVFEHLSHRVLEVRNNNLNIWKKGKRVTVNIHQVRVYRPRQSDTISSDSHVETLYKDRGGVIGQVDRNQENSKDLGKPRVRRVTVVNEIRSTAGPSHLRNARQGKPPTEGSNHDMTGQYEKARETRTTTNGTNRAAERRPVRSKQATAVRPCPYYLRSRVKQPEGNPEDRSRIEIESIPQNNIRRRSLSMEAFDGDPVDRSE
ncbi:uncharacterized protein TNCV_593171 [Trichonephila clavipes]|nr:uncharacterized protein TNCV_593171 [Trichonephila clavipes]